MPDNDIGWGQGAVNNDIGWGKAKTNNDIGWGAIYDNSPSGDTDLIGASASTFTNTKSIEFDGVDDVVNCGNDSSLAFASDVSISVWVNTTQTTSGAMVGKAYYRLEFLADGRVSWAVYRTSSAGRFAYSTTAINDGNWHHIVATHKANGNQYVYVDGQLEGTTTANTSILTSSANFCIGRRTLTHSKILNGLRDEVAVFNDELSSSDVSSIYNSGTPNDLSSYSSLVSWWRMGDGDTFPTITDNKGDNDGTMTNMASDDIVDFVPDTTVGVANTKSLDFDGSNDYVNAGDKDEYSFGDGTNDSPFSMSFWFYADSLNSTNRVTITKYGDSSNREYIVQVRESFVSAILYDSTNGSNQLIINHTSGVTFNTGQWYHIAFTYDGSSTTEGADLYVDGVVASTATKTKSLGYTAMGNKNSDLQVGARTNGSKYTKGHIDEVALFDYELSADAISEIYSIRGSGRAADMNNLTNATTDPILWYRMGDGDTYPTITNNGSLASADGTMTNMASSSITNFTF